MTPTVHCGCPQQLDAAIMYAILRLRLDVFVVEQQCAYPELDGRDLDPGACWVWAQDGAEIVATLRILREPDGRARIGRVATTSAQRGRGLSRQILEEALSLIGEAETVLDAQAHLQDWYERFGFCRSGPDFVEFGIRHVPMTNRGARRG